jgi:hypothetical protein
MPVVTTLKRIYLGGAHHRQPRKPNPAWVQPYNPEVDSDTTGQVTRTAQATIEYTPPQGVTVDALFAFWSASDATGGSTQQALDLTADVGDDDLTLIAWYYLPGGGGEGTGMLIDAYSVAANDFVDEDFVTVTSDPSLTSQANVAGFVPTSKAETVAAFPALSGGEKLEHWLVSSDAASASGATLTAPAQSGGFAFASYHHVALPVADPTELLLGGTILYGIINDGPGVMVVGGRPIHIGPFGPLIGRLLRLVGVYTAAGALPGRSAGEIRRVLARDVHAVAGELGELARRLGG